MRKFRKCRNCEKDVILASYKNTRNAGYALNRHSLFMYLSCLEYQVFLSAYWGIIYLSEKSARRDAYESKSGIWV